MHVRLNLRHLITHVALYFLFLSGALGYRMKALYVPPAVKITIKEEAGY